MDFRFQGKFATKLRKELSSQGDEEYDHTVYKFISETELSFELQGEVVHITSDMTSFEFKTHIYQHYIPPNGPFHTYTGDLVNNKKHGRGKCVWSTASQSMAGCVYEGGWDTIDSTDTVC